LATIAVGTPAYPPSGRFLRWAGGFAGAGTHAGPRSPVRGSRGPADAIALPETIAAVGMAKHRGDPAQADVSSFDETHRCANAPVRDVAQPPRRFFRQGAMAPAFGARACRHLTRADVAASRVAGVV